MKLVQINSADCGSTGGIMLNIASLVREQNGEVFVFCPKRHMKKKREYDYFGTHLTHILSLILSRIGFMYRTMNIDTFLLLKKIDRIQPNVIHMHNLHNEAVNLPMLFGFIKRNNIPVVWTLHDCWSFTGQCPYFTIAKCNKWKTGCYNCPQYRQYPKSYVDRTKSMWKLKKKWFTGVKNMTIVTPSQWLADLVKESFLKDYPVKVIHNGIDLSIFKPTTSDFREKYNIDDKIILLGVAFGWGKRKGLDVFVELSKRLDNRFQIVLVGTDENVDKLLPDNIISIHRTQNQQELAEVYSAADLFVNPTREENYPTVNMESLACGTPIVTFNTGGSPEILNDTCGSVVPCDDVDLLESEIKRICETHPYTTEACLKRAESFDTNDRFKEYIELYRDISE